MLLEIRKRLEHHRKISRIRFSQNDAREAIAESLQLVIDVEPVGQVEITEERNDFWPGVEQRLDEALRFGQQHVGLSQRRRTLPKRELQHLFADQWSRRRPPDRASHELAHQCRLANARLSGNQQVATRRENIAGELKLFVDLESRCQLVVPSRSREIALRPFLEHTRVRDLSAHVSSQWEPFSIAELWARDSGAPERGATSVRQGYGEPGSQLEKHAVYRVVRGVNVVRVIRG